MSESKVVNHFVIFSCMMFIILAMTAILLSWYYVNSMQGTDVLHMTFLMSSTGAITLVFGKFVADMFNMIIKTARLNKIIDN